MPSGGFAPLAFPAIGNPDTERELEGARQRGHAAGYAEGTRRAEAELRAKLLDLEANLAAEISHTAARSARAVAVLTAATEALAQRTAPVLAEADDALAAASIDLAEAIIGHALADAPGSARAAIARALDHQEAASVIAVRLNPDDLSLLDADILAAAPVRFTADPTLSRGDAIAEFPVGLLDARIGAALDRARAELLGDVR
ncbi:FliH/SctL family protein [Glaciihabitans sp. dw_435]|uniref:FliH/SctL family protein n=1 Tax=Glaciihabitans sp. dw_435 TaxID=2720081 RepID=UPI001BD5D117|nr:FliH/SctL family protein [Glaciihabitans sp. dw_435]